LRWEGGDQDWGGEPLRIVAFKTVLMSVAGLLCAGLMLAGCASIGGKKEPEPEMDPNLYPSGYEVEIVNVLRGYLVNSSDYTRASISAPALKAFDQQNRYIVCVRLDAIGKEKLAIFNNGRLSQFIDATPQYCGGVAYRPFTELEAARPK
jgi:hypothetical protein